MTKANKMNNTSMSLESRFYTPGLTSGALSSMRKGFCSTDLRLTPKAQQPQPPRKQQHHPSTEILRNKILYKRLLLTKIRLWQESVSMRIASPTFERQRFVEFMIKAKGCCLQISGSNKKNYIFMRCIGRGGFSVVWEVMEQQTAKLSAAKFTIYPDNDKFPQAAKWISQCFTKEVMDFSTETHPHLLEITDFFHWRIANLNGFATIHPLCLYDLGKWLKMATSEERNSKISMKWLMQIALALERLHVQRRMVHMDLKPQNLLVTDDGDVKVSDFGLHLLMEESENRPISVRVDLSDTANCTGTISYQPPEYWTARLEKKRDYYVDATFDVWSLGCVAFELWSGERFVKVSSPANGVKDVSELYVIAIEYLEAMDLHTRLLACIHCEHKRKIIQTLLMERPTGSSLIKLFN